MAMPMKRPYSGSSRTGRFKRTRYSRRRPVRRNAQRNTYVGSSKGNANALGYSRGGSRKHYKKLLWDASVLSTHNRSYSSEAFAISSPVNNIDMATDDRPFMKNSFWTTGGGAVSTSTLQTGQDIIIRGGVARLQCLNVDAQTAFVTVWVVRSTIKGSAPVTGTHTVGWDPTIEADFQENFKILYKKEFTLQVGESMSLSRRIHFRKIDTDMYNSGYSRDSWMCGVQSMESGAATQVQFVSSFNMSYSLT